MNTYGVSEEYRRKLAEEHSNIRQNPQNYIPILEKNLKYFKGDVFKKPGQNVGLQTQEGPEAVRECIEFLKNQSPMGGLTLDDELSKASQDHADDIGPNGICGHDGSDGSSMDDRISRYVKWERNIAENIDFGSETAQEVLLSLIVDDGVPTRGHRETIFNPELNFMGVGRREHTEYGVLTVIDYCGGISGKKPSNSNKSDHVQPSNNKNNKKNNNNHNNDNENDDDDSYNNYNNNKNNKNNNHHNYNNDNDDDDDSNNNCNNNNKNNKNNNKKNNNQISNFNNFDDNFKDDDFFNTKIDDLMKRMNNDDGDEDTDKPENTVGTSIKTVITTVNGKTVKKKVKTYTLSDGTKKTVVEMEDN